MSHCPLSWAGGCWSLMCWREPVTPREGGCDVTALPHRVRHPPRRERRAVSTRLNVQSSAQRPREDADHRLLPRPIGSRLPSGDSSASVLGRVAVLTGTRAREAVATVIRLSLRAFIETRFLRVGHLQSHPMRTQDAHVGRVPSRRYFFERHLS